ncbi:MAG: helix-turn-helix transcriptional regulator [Bradymonadales bacterium]|nr:helix-turn-helix transcriptional regulator [Bradymonadales bacterium]
MELTAIRNACTETLIISLLIDRPMHGYEIGKEIERRSRGYFQFKHSTLYPVLHRLERRGLISGEWVHPPGGKPQKRYHLTEAGDRYSQQDAASWGEFIAAMGCFLEVVMP